MITLSADALCEYSPNIVPHIYDWHAKNDGTFDWILMEKMSGEPLAEAFDTMSLFEKKKVLQQMARILKALQDFKLPDNLDGWGGVTVSQDGHIANGPLSTLGSGPWSSLQDSYRGQIRSALHIADDNPLLDGWKINDLRSRLDAFAQEGLLQQISNLSTKNVRSIIHGDFSRCLAGDNGLLDNIC